ncbi:MAG: SET domain-containing protein [Caldilineaceae bacterium]
MIRVGNTKAKGRGVFAENNIKEGETIERAPVLVLPDEQWQHINRTLLFNYCYGWHDETALALGFGSLYNHSYTPNAYYVKRYEEYEIEIVALRDIAADEEILINYNGDPNDKDELWFAVVTEPN